MEYIKRVKGLETAAAWVEEKLVLKRKEIGIQDRVPVFKQESSEDMSEPGAPAQAPRTGASGRSQDTGSYEGETKRSASEIVRGMARGNISDAIVYAAARNESLASLNDNGISLSPELALVRGAEGFNRGKGKGPVLPFGALLISRSPAKLRVMDAVLETGVARWRTEKDHASGIAIVSADGVVFVATSWSARPLLWIQDVVPASQLRPHTVIERLWLEKISESSQFLEGLPKGLRGRYRARRNKGRLRA